MRQEPRRRSAVRIAIAVALVLGLQAAAWLVYCAVEKSRAAERAAPSFAYEAVRKPAPALEIPLELPNGSSVRLKEYAADAVLVHFWASWCAPCRTELPTLLALAREPPSGQRLRVVLVSVDENWATVRHYFDGDIPGEVVLDAKGRVKQAFGVSTLPETCIVGPGLTLLARVHGARDWTSSAARDALRVLTTEELR